MNIISIPRYIVLCLVVTSSFFAVRCGVAHAGTDPDLDCGAEKNWHGLPGFVGSKLDNGIRQIIFQAKDEPTDICSKQHATPRFSVLANNPLTTLPAGVKVFASVQLPFVRPSTVEMINDGEGNYRATVDVGLTQGFSGRAASIGMQIIFEFQTRGGISQDSQYVYDHLLLMDIFLDYREHVDGL